MAVFTAISAAITAISGWTITIGSLGTFAIGNFLLRTAVQLGVSALTMALSGKPRAEPFSIQGSIRTGGNTPRAFMLGPSLTAGTLAWHSEWGEDGGTPNAFYTQVIALSDLPVAGLRRWFIEGRAVTLEDTGDERGLAAVEYREGGKDHAWVRFHDGNQTEADPFLVGTVSKGAPRDYSPARVGWGVAYAVVTFRVHREIFTGFPRSKFVLDGVKLYDASKDTTNGGTGTQRWDDPATWGGDGDALPAVQAYNLARGLYYAAPALSGAASEDATIPLGDNVSTISLEIIGGGGGGKESTLAGGDTVVTLKDGATVVQTWTASGGAARSAGAAGEASPRPPYGAGAPGQAQDVVQGGRAEGEIRSPFIAGGAAGALVTVANFDVSGLADPILEITAGAAAPGAGFGGMAFTAALASAPKPQWFYGLQGLTGARLPAAHWVSQIEKCRAQIEGESGLEPIYRSAGEITVNSEIGAAFEAILTACAGRMSEVGGIFKIYVGAPDAPVAHFDDADIVSLAPQSFTPFYGLSDTINGVIGAYPSPDEGYVMRSTPPIYNAAYEAEDGGRRLMADVQLSFVPFPAQAQRLLVGELAAARRARRHTFTLPARYRLVEPGDVVTWTSSRNGYEEKSFRVDGIIDLPNCDLIVDITEVDAADHGDWQHSRDYTPFTPAPMPPVRPAPQAVAGFRVTARDVQDGVRAARRPGLNLTWDTAIEGIAGVMFEVRLQDTGEMVGAFETQDFDAGAYPVSEGILPATYYEARAKYIPAGARAVDWSLWEGVLTNDVRLVGDDLAPVIRDNIDAVPGIADRLTAARGVADGVRTDHNALVDGFLNLNLAEAFGEVDQETASLSSRIDNIKSAQPNNFEDDGKYWTHSIAGDPDAWGGLNSSIQFRTVPDAGRVAYAAFNISSNGHVSPKTGYLPFVAGNTYRMRIKVRHVGALASGTPLIMLMRKFDETYVSTGDIAARSIPFVAANTWETYELECTATGSAAYVLPFVYFTSAYNNPGAEVEIRLLDIADITDASKVSATLTQDYLTAVDTDQAISAAKTEVRADITRVTDRQFEANWENGGRYWVAYYTQSESDLPDAVSLVDAYSDVNLVASAGEGQVLRLEGTTTRVMTERGLRPFVEGQNIRVRLRMRLLTGSPGFRVWIAGTDHTGAYAQYAEVNGGVTNLFSGWTTYEFEFNPYAVRAATANTAFQGAANWRLMVGFGYTATNGRNELASIEMDDVTASASVKTLQTAVTDLEGNASAGYLIKAQAGGEVSLIDLIAADGSAGSASVAKIQATDILLDGSVYMSQLAVMDLSKVFSETFENYRAEDWDFVSGGGEVAAVSDPGVTKGGKVLRVGSESGNDQAWLVHKRLIPFDPDKTYRFRVRVYRTGTSEGSFFAGFAGVGADGVTLVNTGGNNSYSSQHYHGVSNMKPSGWVEYIGYTKGRGSPGDTPPGTTSSPAKAHSNVHYIRPLLLANYNGQPGKYLIDYFEIEEMSGAATIEDGAISARHLTVASVEAQHVKTDAIEARHVKAGEIGADKLNVGLGGNLLRNSEFLNGLSALLHGGSGALHSGSVLRIRTAGESWAGVHYPTLELRTTSATPSASGYTQVHFRPSSASGAGELGYAVTPNSFYEFHVQISNHRAKIQFYIFWYDAGNTYLGATSVGVDASGVSGSSNNPETWGRHGGVGTAPSTAAYAVPVVRIYEQTGNGSGYAFMHKPYFGKTVSATADRAEWSPGGNTTIDGGNIVTGSLQADKIQIDNITLDSDGNGNLILKNNGVSRVKILDGAVSDGATDIHYPSGIHKPDVSYSPSIFTGSMSWEDVWTIAWAGEIAPGSYSTSTNKFGTTTTYYRSRALCEYRTQKGGVWSGWQYWGDTVWSGYSGWTTYSRVMTITGDYQNVEVRTRHEIENNGAGTALTNARNITHSVKAVVK